MPLPGGGSSPSYPACFGVGGEGEKKDLGQRKKNLKLLNGFVFCFENLTKRSNLEYAFFSKRNLRQIQEALVLKA